MMKIWGDIRGKNTHKGEENRAEKELSIMMRLNEPTSIKKNKELKAWSQQSSGPVWAPHWIADRENLEREERKIENIVIPK